MKYKPTNEVFSPSPREGLPVCDWGAEVELRHYDSLRFPTGMVVVTFMQTIKYPNN